MFAEPFMEACIAQLISLGLTGGLLWLLHRKLAPLDLSVDYDRIAYKGCFMALIGVFASVSIGSGLAAVISCFGDWNFLTDGNVAPEFALMDRTEKLLMLIAAAIMAPIIEEIIFRGVLLGSLNKVLGMQRAVFISSLCFGLLHGTSLVTVLFTALMGIILAYTYLAYGNLINNILVHGLYNYMTLQAVFGRESEAAELPDPQLAEILPSAIFMIAGGSALCIIICRSMNRKIRNNLWR
jgi:membrane protease YdiL (CAAX protease family)